MVTESGRLEEVGLDRITFKRVLKKLCVRMRIGERKMSRDRLGRHSGYFELGSKISVFIHADLS